MYFDQYNQPDFETRQQNRTRDLFTYVIAKLIAQTASLKTAIDEEEKQELRTNILLSVATLISLLTAYMIDDADMTESAKKILR